MPQIKVVIGANYGDEGKGLITDHLARKYNAHAVVRFNGGAQAGHTVVTEDSRQVFHHFGSGTLAGIPTILTSDFIVNPILFCRELKDLSRYRPGVKIHSSAIITTPYDMMLNQFSAAKLGHGSCGMGINETVSRSKAFEITLNDSIAQVRYKLSNILVKWVPNRVKELGLTLTPEQQDLMNSNEIIDRFLEDYWAMSSMITFGRLDRDLHKSIVFEGAQGLGLDEFNGAFPHVTRSRTGLTNVERICKGSGITDVEVYYVTRAYLTRHGNGPMENELYGVLPSKSVVELTNVTNEYQGQFRYGYLDLDVLKQRITVDMKNTKLRVSPKLVVTCLDQMDGFVRYYQHGDIKTADVRDFPSIVARYIGIPYVMTSYGPTSKDVSDEVLSW
jgi:adenylosuccinate synthase